MRIGKSTWERLPDDLQRLFNRLPNLGSEEVIAAFPDAPGQQGALTGNEPSPTFSGSHIYGSMARTEASTPRGDVGSAARFFYTAKADADDRLGSKHPTVQPVDLMQWLVRLVTPKGGLVLDPFAGTGTTAEACFREGMRCVLVERETEYQSDIRRRMALVLAGPDERLRESIKAKTKDRPVDAGPLFGFSSEET
jgi:DNA modification methylase